jgi:hypothetical protein
MSERVARPLTLTFNIPDPKIATDTVTLFKAIETLETAFIATYVAAALNKLGFIAGTGHPVKHDDFVGSMTSQ